MKQWARRHKLSVTHKQSFLWFNINTNESLTLSGHFTLRSLLFCCKHFHDHVNIWTICETPSNICVKRKRHRDWTLWTLMSSSLGNDRNMCVKLWTPAVYLSTSSFPSLQQKHVLYKVLIKGMFMEEGDIDVVFLRATYKTTKFLEILLAICTHFFFIST